MVIKAIMLLVFFSVMVGIGLYCRKNATDVNGFVLGGRSVGPWLTAFAYGTSYFSAVVFVGYAGQFGWKYGIAATWAESMSLSPSFSSAMETVSFSFMTGTAPRLSSTSSAEKALW